MFEITASLGAFGFGAIVGSFLNVCILRLPEGKSIVSPGSHCYGCGKPIVWYDNIPVFSFFILGGRCRACRTKISPQYVIVEILTGLVFVLLYRRFGISVKGIIYVLISCALVVESGIDLKYRIIPDFITLPGIGLGLGLSALFPFLHSEQSRMAGFLQSLVGILAGGGFLYASAIAAEFFLKKEAMGGGDIKLLGMLGAFLGWRGSFWIIFVSSLIGSVFGVYQRLRHGEEAIPFGPYLAIAAFLYMLFGEQAIVWYSHYAGWS